MWLLRGLWCHLLLFSGCYFALRSRKKLNSFANVFYSECSSATIVPMPMEGVNVIHEKYYLENCSCALKYKIMQFRVAVCRITCILLDVKVEQVCYTGEITGSLREAVSFSTDENQRYLLPYKITERDSNFSV